MEPMYETISSVLGKNEHFGKLTKAGKILVKVLNFIDKGHCFNQLMKMFRTKKPLN